jgi:hypothetical protein
LDDLAQNLLMNSRVSDILSGVDILRQKHRSNLGENTRKGVEVRKVITALQSFSDCVRYLNTRRSGGALLTLENEAAVQDALYLMLRPWIIDLVPETPTDRVANRYAIKDFLSKASRLVIEAKYVRTADHGKAIVKELNDDIETYRYHSYCDDLIFFIYDPDGFIPDGAALERHLTSGRVYDEKVLRCHAVIKP